MPVYISHTYTEQSWNQVGLNDYTDIVLPDWYEAEREQQEEDEDEDVQIEDTCLWCEFWEADDQSEDEGTCTRDGRHTKWKDWCF